MRHATVLGSASLVTGCLVAIATACTGSDPVPTPVINVVVDGGSSGTSGTSTGTSGSNGTSGSDGGSSGTVNTGPCDPAAPFGPAQPLTELHAAGTYEYRASVTADELTIYFLRVDDHATAGGGGTTYFEQRMVHASRDDRTKPFSSTQGVGFAGEPPFEISYPGISADEKRLVLGASGPSGDGNAYHLWLFTRTTTTAAWDGRSYDFESGGKSIQSFGTKINPDGVYFKGTSDNGENYVPYRASFAGDGGLDTPIVMKIDRTQEIGDFVTFDDGQSAYFDSNTGGTGQYDIFTVTRPDKTKDEWGTPTLVVEASSELDDRVAGVSSDGCRIYFTRDFKQGDDSSTSRIFVAAKPPK